VNYRRRQKGNLIGNSKEELGPHWIGSERTPDFVCELGVMDAGLVSGRVNLLSLVQLA
jgi:hypothetical protein